MVRSMANGHDITNKTEFMRYLDDHEDEVPGMTKRRTEYRQLRVSRKSFGFWLRWKHLNDFNRAYNKWWMKHPNLFDKNQTVHSQ